MDVRRGGGHRFGQEEVVDMDWAAYNERISFSTGPAGTNPVADKLYVARSVVTERLQIENPLDVGSLSFTYDEN